MAEPQFRIAEIEISKSPREEKILGFFRYDGGTSRKSTLLIVAEIHSTLYSYERLLDVINSTAEQTKHLIAGVEQDPIARFEKLVQRLNDRVAEFAKGEPTPIAWNRVNIFVLELSPQHICLTGIGQLMNLFLQKQEDSSYRGFDLFGSLEQRAETDPNKPFASLICGDVKPGDTLMVGTLNFERIRNELRIKERLTSLAPVAAAVEIKKDVERSNVPDDFLAVIAACCILEIPNKATIDPLKHTTDKSTASIQKFLAAQQEAAHHLSPAITPAAAPVVPDAGLPQRITKKARELLNTFRRRVQKTDRAKDTATLARLRGMNAGHGNRFTKKHRMIALGIALVSILGISAFGWWRHTQRVLAEERAWDTAFSIATDHRNRAEADLVYGNDSRARTEIESSERTLSGLGVVEADKKSNVEKLRQELSQLRERLRKRTVVEPLSELFSLPDAPAGSLTAPVLTKTHAYAVDNVSHTVLKIDPQNKNLTRIPLPTGTQDIVAGSQGKQSIVFTTADGNFYAVNATTDAVIKLANQPKASSTVDLVLYAERSYSLDGPSGQVWRAQSGTTGFGAEQAYIKTTSTNLSGAVGLAIDSMIYILRTDGTVIRFLSGAQENFALPTIDPPLRAASGIWTSADTDRIVISDPAEKRVLVFSKDGALKAQLTSDQLTGPRDLDGEETTPRILVIDGTKLLLFSLP